MKKWTNAWIFRDLYWEHCWASPPWLRGAIAQGQGSLVTENWVRTAQAIRTKAIAGMKDVEGFTVLSVLKDRRYGELGGPGWEHLQQDAHKAGIASVEDAYLWIAEWAIRTHGPPVDERNRRYKAVLKPTELFRDMKAQSAHWVKTDNAEYPWECASEDGWRAMVRIGDFPIDHLYHVYRDGQHAGVTDDWPTTWTRQSWIRPSMKLPETAARKRTNPGSDDRGSNGQIDRIIEKLGRLRDSDTQFSIFGSMVHKYDLGPPLSEGSLKGYERDLGSELPFEYRQFLTHVGHGGAGPYYGLYRLDQEDVDATTDIRQTRKPFRWQESFNPYDWEDPCSQEDVWCTALEDEDATGQTELQVMLSVPGVLYFCDCGCGIRCFLIVRGDCVGEVWCDSQVDECGITPEYGTDGKHQGFLDWYEKWLDDGIAAFPKVKDA
jgi:hypothetical protein